MKIVQVNISANRGSTGKIAEGIGKLVLAEGWESYLAYGGSHRQSASQLIRIGTRRDIYCHAFESRLFDNHGLSSRQATRRFIDQIKEIKPDIIHLHNIHDYYLNYPILFEYINKTNTPVVWTLHDCWPFTGHCSHIDSIKCMKWKEGCHHCQGLNVYPKSWFSDRSERNYALKKALFLENVENMTLVPVSHWIEGFVRESFLKETNIKTIHNGIDLETFKVYDGRQMRKKYGMDNRFVILGVAAPWTPTKGLADFIKLHAILPKEEFAIMLVGLSEKQIGRLPEGVIGISRTDSPQELAEIYSMADVFFNPTYEDNYPTTNLEAIACGTPALVYDTGGCKEAVGEDVGFVVRQGDVAAAAGVIQGMTEKHLPKPVLKCRRYAEEHFDGDQKFAEYIDIYKSYLK